MCQAWVPKTTHSSISSTHVNLRLLPLRMDVCRGDILPISRDVMLGIKSFSGGICLAYLVASVSCITSVLFSSDQAGSWRIRSMWKIVVSFVPHAVFLVNSLDFSSLTYNWKDVMGVTTTDMSNWEDFAAIASAASLIVAGSEKNTNRIPLAACATVYLACVYTIRTTIHHNIGSLCLVTAGFALLAVLLMLFATDRRLLSGEQRALRGNLLILLVFHCALYCLQIGETVPAEVASLCYALVAGCVRYNVTAVCCKAVADAANADEHVAYYDAADEAVGESAEVDEDDRESEEVDTHGVTVDCNALSMRSASEEDLLTPTSVQKEVDMFQMLNQRAADSGIKRVRTCSVEVTNENSESHSRRQLLRYVFHEMRAPLNAISMAVDLLTNQYKTGATPKSRKADLETLQMIEESTLTMERTLKDSMTLQKIEEGLLVPQLKIFSIYDMCDDINDALSQVLKSSSVAFRYEVQDSVPLQVVGDHFRVRHVVAHVLSNAIKYSQPGSEVTMTVHIADSGAPVGSQSAESDAVADAEEQRSSESSVGLMREASYLEGGNQMQVVFCVTDRGVGMSAELQQSDIFKPFSMLKTEDLRASRGSGLGLAICKKIMEFLRGSISYTSIPNQGTTFEVVCPLARMDTASMDEYDSDEEDCAGGDTVGAAYASVMRSPDISVRHKIALSKAKSFRGQKLYSLIQTPSSVFDCPTPQSKDESSMEFSFSASGSEKGAPVERRHCTGEYTLGSIEESQSEDTPRIDVTTVASPLVPTRTMENLPPPTAPGSPRQYAKASISPGKSHRQMLSIETMTLTGVTAAADSQRQSLSSYSAADVAGEPTQTSTAATDGGSIDAMPRRNKDYASMTEKNVNLNILRTASSDVARALQMPGRKPSFMRQPLSEVLSACKILVVDDAPSNRKLLSMLLRRAGFGTVDLVEDGQAAVNYCQALSAEEQPSIIFMDNTMPKLTGVEASRIIRAGGYKYLIIGVTGNSLEEELDEFITAGADLVIVKPLKNQSIEMLLGFIQVNGFESAHGFRIDQVGKEYTWVPREES